MSGGLIWVAVIVGTTAQVLLRSPALARVMALFWLVGGVVIVWWAIGDVFAGDWWSAAFNGFFGPWWLWNAYDSSRDAREWEAAR